MARPTPATRSEAPPRSSSRSRASAIRPCIFNLLDGRSDSRGERLEAGGPEHLDDLGGALGSERDDRPAAARTRKLGAERPSPARDGDHALEGRRRDAEAIQQPLAGVHQRPEGFPVPFFQRGATGAYEVAGEPEELSVELGARRVALAKPADRTGRAAYLAAQCDDEIERLPGPQSLDPRGIAPLEPDDVTVPRGGHVRSRGGAVEDVLDSTGVPAHIVARRLQTGEVRQSSNQRDAERGRAAEPAGGWNSGADLD